jgi:hypothetical protein
MARKCFTSFKAEDIEYKDYIRDHLDVDMIDKSLQVPISSTDPDYIMRRIREDYLSDSTVTIHLIGKYSGENRGWLEQQYIKRELQASLYDSATNTKNGVLGIVLPPMHDAVYRGIYRCTTCGGSHNLVSIDDETTISEFSYNFYIPNGKCSHTDDERYCVLVSWSDFVADPNAFVEAAFDKRFAPIAAKTRVYPSSAPFYAAS